MNTNSSSSLDSWREFFRRGDSDIFVIINQAIMVAATDYPNKFNSKRDKIAELLFSCRMSRCIGCNHRELSIPEDDEINLSRPITGGDTAVESLSSAIEEFSMVSKEVCRIKEILLNKENETTSVLLESLRKLKLMSLNVEILKSTEIGKAVNRLSKHNSDNIRQLSKTLITEWKELVDQWVNSTKEITGTPESVNPSVVDEEEEEEFPSLPYDVDIFTPEPNGFEISQFFDSLDFDGNLSNSGEQKTNREDDRRRNISERKPEGTQMRIQNASFKPVKQSTEKPTKPVGTEHNRKASGTRQEKLKNLDEDAKFEFAKRKLQESYQQHEKAKKQRTIQVLETIPKQQKPQLKKPGFNKNWRK